MKKVKPPANRKKRLYKMMKHLGNPMERWWEIDASILSYDTWCSTFGEPLGLVEKEMSETSMSEEHIRRWVDGLYSIGFDAERTYWLSVYQDVYLPLVERVMEQSRQTGFGLKTLSSVYVGSRNFPVWTDCWVSPSGMTVFTESRPRDAVGIRLPATLRSVFRPAPSVVIPAWMIADYYQARSQKYARRFDLSLSDGGEGWSLGDVTESVDLDALQGVLADGGELLGRGLIEWSKKGCRFDSNEDSGT